MTSRSLSFFFLVQRGGDQTDGRQDTGDLSLCEIQTLTKGKKE